MDMYVHIFTQLPFSVRAHGQNQHSFITYLQRCQTNTFFNVLEEGNTEKINGKYRKGWGGGLGVGAEGGWHTVYFASGFLLYVVGVSLQPVPWVAHRSIYISTFQSDKTFYWQIFNAHTTYNRLEKKNKTVSKVQHPMFLTELQFQRSKHKVYYKKLIHTV